MNVRQAHNHYGVTYFEPGASAMASATASDPYYYEVYAGRSQIQVERGDSVFWLLGGQAISTRGPAAVASDRFAVKLRGFAPDDRTVTFSARGNLPYINGCSSKQLLPPERPGDPTLQLLYMPPFTSEQAHHIHSTVRCVYILEGKGTSVVGMGRNTTSTPLRPGMIGIFERMCPHHFTTDEEPLVALPVHVWSTIPGAEMRHPMLSGTHLINQG